MSVTKKELSISARLDQVDRVRDLIHECALKAGLSRQEAYQAQLAVSEACENVINHGYRQESSEPIRVVCTADEGELTIEIFDSAPPFNPASKPEEKPWDEGNPPIGGLGLVIIHRVMDEVEYRREGSENHLTMRKRKREDA